MATVVAYGSERVKHVCNGTRVFNVPLQENKNKHFNQILVRILQIPNTWMQNIDIKYIWLRDAAR